MPGENGQPLVIKRVKKVRGGGHHGGAWKIAYADFVTAMMAFFLLMWLLGSTTKGDLEGIADFFSTPLKVAMAGGSGSGDSSSIIQGGGQDLWGRCRNRMRRPSVKPSTCKRRAPSSRRRSSPSSRGSSAASRKRSTRIRS